MQTLFLGNIKNLFHPDKNGKTFQERLMNNLGTSNYGLHKSDARTVSPMDAFEVTKNISELLSPACGMTEEEKQTYFNKIMAKLKSGKKLTAEEMRFLQSEHPELYQQAARVQAMRDGFEAQLKSATSKQKAQEIYAHALSHVSDKDPMKEYIVAAYQDAMKEFEESGEYKELPETEEEAKGQTYKKKINMDFTVEFTDNEEAS